MQDQLSLLQRLQMPMPKFFRVVFYAAMAVAAVSAGLTSFQADLVAAGMPIPALLAKAIEVVGYLSAGVAIVSRLTVRSDK